VGICAAVAVLLGNGVEVLSGRDITVLVGRDAIVLAGCALPGCEFIDSTGDAQLVRITPANTKQTRICLDFIMPELYPDVFWVVADNQSARVRIG